jgi:hypothetical protein
MKLADAHSNLRRVAITWLVAFIAAVYTLTVTAKYGPAISSDSIHYMTAAWNLAQHGVLSTYTGHPLVSYAPFLSWMYALLGMAGLSMETAARLVNAASYAAVILIVGNFVTSLPIPNNAVFTYSVLTSLLSVSLTGMSPVAMSEVLFIALVFAAFWNAYRFVQTGKSWHYYCMCAASAAAALTRYIGVTAVFACFLTIVMLMRLDLPKRLVLSLTYALIALIPLCFWLARNFVLTGTFMGYREPSIFTIREMVFDTAWAWSSWFVPFRFRESTTLFALLVSVGLVMFIVHSYRHREEVDAARKLFSFLMINYIVTYSVALFYSAARIQFEGLSTRMWAPISIPVMLLTILHGVHGYSKRSTLCSLLHAFALFATVTWTVAGAVNAVRIGQQGFRHGLGVFGGEDWRNSETCRFLRQVKLSGTVYSNFPEPLYYYSRIVSIQTPHRGPVRVAFETYPRTKEQFIAQLQEDEALNKDAYIVWFTDRRRSHFMLGLDELQQFLDLDEQRRFKDGFIFRAQLKRQATEH